MRSCKTALILCLLIWQLTATGWAAELKLVLVASKRSPIAQLSPNEVRKLYLGIPLFVDGQTIKPLGNSSDQYLQEVFMQKIIFMSTQAYERQILSRVFRVGGTRPPIYNDLDKLVAALQDDPSTVSYMSDIEAINHGLKIINELWEKEK
ncbi:MAG: hypothetical protein V4443_11325 [Pseudomonadota bacterium]